MPQVSVIVPVFNSEISILGCAESILSQCFSDLELIFVNDGSTDNTADVLAQIALQDSRVKVFEHSNRGSGETRNKGLQHAQGQYICFVDSDDTIATDMLQKLLSKASNGVDIVVSDFYEVSDTGNTTVHQFQGALTFDGYFGSIISFQSASSIWAKLYHRSLFQNELCLFPTGLRNNEDNATLYKLLYYAKKIEFIAEPLYYWHRSSNSKSKNIGELRVKETIKVLSQRRQFLQDHELLSTYLSQFYAGLIFTLALRKTQILEYHVADSRDRLIQIMYASVLNYQMLEHNELRLLRQHNRFDYWLCVFHFSTTFENHLVQNLEGYFDNKDWHYALVCAQREGRAEVNSLANYVRDFLTEEVFIYGVGMSWEKLQAAVPEQLNIAGYIDRSYGAKTEANKFNLDGAFLSIPKNAVIIISSVDQAKHIYSQIVNHPLYPIKTPVLVSFTGVHYAQSE